MTDTSFLLMPAERETALARLLLAHGAGAPMTSPFMETIAAMLAARGIAVARFEFPYMAARRDGGKNRPAPKAETLAAAYIAAVQRLTASAPDATTAPLLIGGKSLGGRVASLVADELHAAGRIAGTVVLGYPFHPPGMPEKLRTAHLADMKAPMLIVQGERDPFGGRDEIEAMTAAGALAPSIALAWAADGDHDLGPRGNSGHTRKGNLTAAAAAVAAFTRRR